MTNPMEEITRCEGCPHEDDGLACPPGNFCRAELEDQIQTVRELRALYASIEENINEKQAAWVKENEKLLRTGADHKAKLYEAEASLRELTLAAYKSTGSKKPADGVGIRIVKQLHYDEAEALVWAIESGVESCLSLQKANFNKAAEGLKLDFVKIEEIPQATIAREL